MLLVRTVRQWWHVECLGQHLSAVLTQLNHRRSRALTRMPDSKTLAIQAILIDVDKTLQDRLAAIGVDLSYLIVIVGPDGQALVSGNGDPAGLKELVKEIEALDMGDDPVH